MESIADHDSKKKQNPLSETAPGSRHGVHQTVEDAPEPGEESAP